MRAAKLSPREREVITLVAAGRTTNEIADDLGLSPLTIKTHVERILAKYGAPTRAAAVARAFRARVIPLGEVRPDRPTE